MNTEPAGLIRLVEKAVNVAVTHEQSPENCPVHHAGQNGGRDWQKRLIPTRPILDQLGGPNKGMNGIRVFFFRVGFQRRWIHLPACARLIATARPTVLASRPPANIHAVGPR